jgi:hypothetical protein
MYNTLARSFWFLINARYIDSKIIRDSIKKIKRKRRRRDEAYLWFAEKLLKVALWSSM